jgi:hypothetical protein
MFFFLSFLFFYFVNFFILILFLFSTLFIDGEALEFASLNLRSDRDIVLEAISVLLRALKWASEELRADVGGWGGVGGRCW